MVVRAVIAMSLVSGFLWGACERCANAASDYAFFHENVLGTSLELRVRADNAEVARRAEARVLGEIDRLTDTFSSYESSSEFRRWQASHGAMRVSSELFEVFRACDDWLAQSRGLFDPRVKALSDLWSRTAAQNRVPGSSEIEQARALMSAPAWQLDVVSQTAERLSDCPLSLDGIAKGYIVERACAVALDRGNGVRGVLLNVGGDLRVCGDMRRTIGIADPLADSETTEPISYFEVKDRAVATSGSSQRGFRVQGKIHSHIFDPRSGAPTGHTASATVVAGRSVEAEVFAKVFNILPPDESVRLARTIPGLECLIVGSDGQIARSDDWGRLERLQPVAVALADDPKKSDTSSKAAARSDKPAQPAPRDPWVDQMELVVRFEINRPSDTPRGYRRPYVAIWVEDKDGFPVRNLTLWVSMGGAGPYQWTPEMKRWFKSDEKRKEVDRTDMIQTIARPTRPPGKYTVIWDGKDDRKKPLDRGEYTLYIDAAREHGTYQTMQTRVTLADKPFTEELKGNVEIKSATVEYRRKTPAKK